MGIGGSKEFENGEKIITGAEVGLELLKNEFEKTPPTGKTTFKISDFYNVVDGVPSSGEIAYSDFLGKDYRPDPPSSVVATPDWPLRTDDGQSKILVAAIPEQSGNIIEWVLKTVTYGTRGNTWSITKNENAEYNYSTAASNFDYGGYRYYGFTANGSTYYARGTTSAYPANSQAMQSRTTTQNAVTYPNAALLRSQINTVPYNGAGMYDTGSNVTINNTSYDIFGSTNSSYSSSNLCANSTYIYYYVPYQAAYYSQSGPFYYSTQIWTWTRNTTTSNVNVDQTFTAIYDVKTQYWRHSSFRNAPVIPYTGQLDSAGDQSRTWKPTELRYVPYPSPSGTVGTYLYYATLPYVNSVSGSDGLTHEKASLWERRPTTSWLWYQVQAWVQSSSGSTGYASEPTQPDDIISITEDEDDIVDPDADAITPQGYSIAYTPHPEWVPEYVHQDSNNGVATGVSGSLSYAGSTQWQVHEQFRYEYGYEDGNTKSVPSKYWYYINSDFYLNLYIYPEGTLRIDPGDGTSHITGVLSNAGSLQSIEIDGVWYKRGTQTASDTLNWNGNSYTQRWYQVGIGEPVWSTIRVIYDGVLQYSDTTRDTSYQPTNGHENTTRITGNPEYNRGNFKVNYTNSNADSVWGDGRGYCVKLFYEANIYNIRRYGTYSAETYDTDGTLRIWWGNSYNNGDAPNHQWNNVEETALDNNYYVGNDYFQRGDYQYNSTELHMNKVSKFTYQAAVQPYLNGNVYYDPPDTPVQYSFSNRSDYEKTITELPYIPPTPAYTLGLARQYLYSEYDTNPDSWTSSESYSLNWFSGRNFTNKTQNGYYLSTIRGTTATPSAVIESNTKTKATVATNYYYISNTNEDIPQRLDFTINAPSDDSDKSLLAAYGLYRIDSSSNSEYSLGYILPESSSFFDFDGNTTITINLQDQNGYYRLSWKGYQNVSLSFKGESGQNFGTPGTSGKEFAYSFPFPTISIAKNAGAGKAGVDLYLEKRVIHTPGYDNSSVWAVVRCADLFEYGSYEWCQNSHFLDMFPNGL